jgi:uncharacterized OB-fold protein
MHATRPVPVVPFLKIPDGGDPYLEGHVCTVCHAIFLGPRYVCSKCGARDQMQVRALSNAGTLYTYSIVHRSLSGIQVPYISAVVDLEGGGTIKGNLIGVEPDPSKIRLGMPVSVVYNDALGRKDEEGRSSLSYFFQPRGRV